MRKANRVLVIFILILSLGVSACNKNEDYGVQPGPEPAPNTPFTKEATVYFSDDQAMYLVAEKRQVQVQKAEDAEQLASAVINQLIAGPNSAELTKTMPPESRLLSLKIENGLATVNFNQELQTRHWGGSSGEIMTLYSIVNTLTEIPGVQKVQLLIEGEKLDSLKGHIDISQPLTRDAAIIKN